MRGTSVLAALVATTALVVWTPLQGSAQTLHPSTLKSSWIQAVFSPADRWTTYSLLPPEDDWPAKSTFSYYWRLTLEAVDPAVGVDQRCNNHGVLSGDDKTFVWKHANIGDPVRDDGCNHDLQGKYGHQGLVEVLLRDNHGWECRASYKGSESSDLNSVDEGVATLPVCVDSCEALERSYNHWNAEFQRISAARYPLPDELKKARSDLKQANAVLQELRDITHDAEPLPYATAAVRDATARVDALAAKLKGIDRAFDEAASLRESYGDDLDDCRGRRRGNARNERALASRSPLGAAACTEQQRALGRAQGNAAAFALLGRLTKPDLGVSATKVATAAQLLHGAQSKPSFRPFRARVESAVQPLRKGSVVLKAAATRQVELKRGAASAGKAVAAAKSGLAACRRRGG